MASLGRALVAPLYLFACLILGGSAQGIWQNMILQLAGVAIIAWAALDRSEEALAPAAKQLLLLTIAAIAVVAIQLLPLPPSFWSHLGPRQAVAEGFRTLGVALPPEPVSLTPAEGLNALLKIIPPLALFCAIVRLQAYRSQWLAAALIAGALAGIGLGAMQVTSANPLSSPWYLYEDTNPGKGVGFFANADHMATLLVVTIPFIAAIVAAAWSRSVQRRAALAATGGAIALVVVVGLGLNGSLAGYGLALPVIAASALLIQPRRSRLRSWTLVVTLLLMIGAVTALEITPIGSGKIGDHARSAVQSRSEILSTTMRATTDFMPFGSGLGSFQRVYPLYERPEQVTSVYVIHAHNDYAELALELGLAGVVLLILFLIWWGAAVWRAWRGSQSGPFVRAAAVASAVIVAHSLVDFPLRTSAIAASFAMCLALLVRGPAAQPKEEREMRPTRHIVI